MNWKKLRSPAKATLKNSNFQSLSEIGITLKDSLRPRFKSPNFESIDELGIGSYVLIYVSLLKLRWRIYTSLDIFQTKHDE